MILLAGLGDVNRGGLRVLSLAENLGGGTLADGFTGLGNLAQGEDLHYAFDVILTEAVPEPQTLWLLASLLTALCGLQRVRKGFQP